MKFIDLPSRTPQPFELAVNGPQTLLREHGWSTVDAMGVSRSLWDYREFIQRLEGGFGVAKHAYVRTAPAGSAIAPSATWPPDGRRSCRTPAGVRTCRLATGLLAFSTPGGGARRPRSHRRRLRTRTPGARSEIAREHFDAARVLPPLLETCVA